MKKKECFKCGARKPFTSFYKHPQMKDGRVNKCKECNKKDVHENRKSKIEYYRAYDRERGNRQTIEYRRRYQENNPIKRGASALVNKAIHNKLLKKPKSCESCGETTSLHGHHDDYSKPLEVTWLCPSCHFVWHAKHGEGLNG